MNTSRRLSRAQSRGFASLILILVIVGLIVLGGAGYWVSKRGTSPGQTGQTASTTSVIQNDQRPNSKTSIDSNFSKDDSYVYFLESLKDGTTKEVVIPDADPKTFHRFDPGIQFVADSRHIYFIEQTFIGYVNKDVPVAGGMSNVRVTLVATSIKLVSGADPSTFTIDGITPIGLPTSQPVVTVTKAHDANHNYTVRQESWGCLGDTAGCPGGNTLTVSKIGY